MTPRTFWAILIKILGVYIILQSVLAIPQFFATAFYFIGQSSGEGFVSSLIGISYLVIAVGFYVLLFYYSIFKTDWIIDKLKLDKGYEDERLEFNIHRATILKIIIMVTGGILLIDNLPLFCKGIFDYFQKANLYRDSRENPEITYLILDFLKTFIGYFMLTCSRMIVNFMEVRRKKVLVEDMEE